MAISNLSGLNFGTLTGQRPITTEAATRGRAGFNPEESIFGSQNVNAQKLSSNDPRGSLFNGFDVSGWNGSPVYEPGERRLDFNA